MSKKSFWALGLVLLWGGAAWAEPAPANSPAMDATELAASPGAAETAQTAATAEPKEGPGAAPAASDAARSEAPRLPWQEGPRDLKLPNDLQIQLPSGYLWLGPKESDALLKRMGNLHNEDVLGMMTTAGEGQWFVVVSYEASGYVKDDEKIDANELLSAMREGVAESNKERMEAGFAEWHVDGWQEEPHYDQSSHRLIWSLTISDKDGASVNYSTRLLGRRGYASLNLVTDPATITKDKPHAAVLLAATSFAPGSRYEDFDASTDEVAEYGLAGLILAGAGVGAAKFAKVGLFAGLWKVILSVLVAGKKLVIVAVAGGAALVAKLFGKKASVAEE
jgi:uncharacterized membrane-anchored protein